MKVLDVWKRLGTMYKSYQNPAPRLQLSGMRKIPPYWRKLRHQAVLILALDQYSLHCGGRERGNTTRKIEENIFLSWCCDQQGMDLMLSFLSFPKVIFVLISHFRIVYTFFDKIKRKLKKRWFITWQTELSLWHQELIRSAGDIFLSRKVTVQKTEYIETLQNVLVGWPGIGCGRGKLKRWKHGSSVVRKQSLTLSVYW